MEKLALKIKCIAHPPPLPREAEKKKKTTFPKTEFALKISLNVELSLESIVKKKKIWTDRSCHEYSGIISILPNKWASAEL